MEIWITICLTNFSHRTLCKWKYKWLVVFETKIDAVGDKWEWLTERFWISMDISDSGMIIWSCKVYSLHKGPCMLIEDIMCSIKLILNRGNNIKLDVHIVKCFLIELNQKINSRSISVNMLVYFQCLCWLVCWFQKKINYCDKDLFLFVFKQQNYCEKVEKITYKD